MDTINPFARIEAMRNQGPTVELETGDTFTLSNDRPYTIDGVRKNHTFVMKVMVTKTDAVGFDYVVLDILDEIDRPTHFDASNGPTKGSMAWFGLEAAINRGDAIVGE